MINLQLAKYFLCQSAYTTLTLPGELISFTYVYSSCTERPTTRPTTQNTNHVTSATKTASTVPDHPVDSDSDTEKIVLIAVFSSAGILIIIAGEVFSLIH